MVMAQKIGAMGSRGWLVIVRCRRIEVHACRTLQFGHPHNEGQSCITPGGAQKALALTVVTELFQTTCIVLLWRHNNS